MPSPSASEIGDDGDDADRPAHNSRDDVHEFEGGNRVRKDDDEGDRKEHGRGPDWPHLGGLARPDPETRPDDEKRRPEGHHELLAEDRHIRDLGSLRRSERGHGRRRFPRMRGTDWPPTRTTLGFPPSVSTLTSMRLAWWISIPCSITNVGAGSLPRKAR